MAHETGVIELRSPGPMSSHNNDSKNGLDSALFNTQHYKVWIKGKLEKSREWSSALTYTSM